MAKISLPEGGNLKYYHTGGDNVYIRQNQTFVRVNPAAYKRKARVQQNVRQLMKTIRSHWKTLTPTQKLAWKNYLPYVPASKSGWNAFLANNMQGLYPNVPCITPILNITSPETPPDIPTGFNACYYSGLDAICISWTHDYAQKTYVQAFEWIPPGRSRVLNEPWRYIDTALSTEKKLLLPSSRLAAGHKSRIFIRALNLRGEVSEKTQFLAPQVPPMPIPDWSGTPLSGYSPLSVQFTDESEGLRFGWGWLFGDSTLSALQNPLKVYTSAIAKKFTVSLTLFGPGGAGVTRTRPGYVTIIPGPPPPITPTWMSLREHVDLQVSVFGNVGFFVQQGEFLDLRIAVVGTSAICGYAFQVYSAAYLQGKKIRIRWEGYNKDATYTLSNLSIYDGTYLRSSDDQFPFHQDIVLQGAGIIQQISHMGSFARIEETITCALGSAQFDNVTIFVQWDHRHNIGGRYLAIEWLKILDTDDTVLHTFDLSSATMEVTGTHADYGYTATGP